MADVMQVNIWQRAAVGLGALLCLFALGLLLWPLTTRHGDEHFAGGAYAARTESCGNGLWGGGRRFGCDDLQAVRRQKALVLAGVGIAISVGGFMLFRGQRYVSPATIQAGAAVSPGPVGPT